MAALAVALGAPLAHAHGDTAHAPKPAVDPSKAKETPFGKAGDPKRVGRVVRLTMSDAMRFSPSELTVRRGETIRFVASNQSQLQGASPSPA